VRCSVLQCVAVCCSALQCAAVRCSVLQCVAVCCSALQCAAARCSVLQCVAVCCSALQCVLLMRKETPLVLVPYKSVRNPFICECLRESVHESVRRECLRESDGEKESVRDCSLVTAAGLLERLKKAKSCVFLCVLSAMLVGLVRSRTSCFLHVLSTSFRFLQTAVCVLQCAVC